MFTVAEVRAFEEAIFARGIFEGDLLEQAGLALAKEFVEQVPRSREVWVCFGPGHNGGDALVAARHLRDWGWVVKLVSSVMDAARWAPLTRKSYERLGAPELRDGFEGVDGRGVVVLDGLLGIGARPGLQGEFARLAGEVVELRRQGAWVVAVDLPSGMDGDTGETGDCAVVADVTITMGTPKRGLIVDGVEDFVGRFALAPIEGFPLSEDEWLMTRQRVAGLLERRRYKQYKSQSGRVGVLAGSRQFPGAARLAVTGALRGGGGLVTLLAEQEVLETVGSALPPEAMMRRVEDLSAVQTEEFDVLVLGPGWGRREREGLREFVEGVSCPVVLDADALFLMAKEEAVLPKHVLVTPHPGEMREWVEGDGLSRAEIARRFVARHDATLLFKGARTIVTARGKGMAYNTTGGPAMASGGHGDVLSGLLGALLAGGMEMFAAAEVGAWMSGRAADWLVQEGRQSERSLLASDVAEAFGKVL